MRWEGGAGMNSETLLFYCRRVEPWATCGKGRNLAWAHFSEGHFGPMSELGKFYLNFAPLGDRNSTMMLVSATYLSIFDHFLDWRYKTPYVNVDCTSFSFMLLNEWRPLHWSSRARRHSPNWRNTVIKSLVFFSCLYVFPLFFHVHIKFLWFLQFFHVIF